jgi:hypothetical protein
MIGDLLDFTGTRLGAKMTVSPAAMDLEILCREVLDEMKSVHPERSFTFESQGDLTGQWDAQRLRQLISNLLGNAVQHGFPTTPIVLAATAAGEELTLAVRNQGTAIHVNSEALLFEPMMRTATIDLCRPAGSIGLGLYIAREVATAHGGSIGYHSDDSGTVFTVRLPRHPATATS